MTLDPAGLEAAAKALAADSDETFDNAWKLYVTSAQIAVRAYFAAAVPAPTTENPYCDPERPRTWARGAEVQFKVWREAFAAGRAAAHPDRCATCDGSGRGGCCDGCGGTGVVAASPNPVLMTDLHDTSGNFADRVPAATPDPPTGHPVKYKHGSPVISDDPAAVSPDERLREAGERLAQAVARVCGEGHPALGMWRVALAAADREAPDEEGRICCRGMGADGGCNICAAEATR